MPRFYFNVTTATETIIDQEGTELANIDVAQSEAKHDALALMSDAMREGRDISSRSIQICDETGHVLLIVPFTSAFSRFG
jgi:TPP-dependent trihydroxycyclohexane-1,2-dione (THcHDO) dehydratase